MSLVNPELFTASDFYLEGLARETGKVYPTKPYWNAGGAGFPDAPFDLTFSGGGGAYHYQSSSRLLSPATADVPVLAYDSEGNVLGLAGFGAIVSIGKHTRDLTNAVWVNASGLATVAKDQVGADGVANSASSFVAGAANDTLLQTVTSASNPYTAGFNIKRLVGTGTVEITVNGGTNWVDITSLINTSAYVRVKDTRTVTNPVYGIRIVTSGDSIAVDFANLVQSTIDLPPVQVGATTVTAPANIITGALPAEITSANAISGACVANVPDFLVNSFIVQGHDNSINNVFDIITISPDKVEFRVIGFGGVKEAGIVSSELPVGENVGFAWSISQTSVSFWMNGVLQGTLPITDYPNITRVNIMCNLSGTGQLNGYCHLIALKGEVIDAATGVNWSTP